MPVRPPLVLREGLNYQEERAQGGRPPARGPARERRAARLSSSSLRKRGAWEGYSVKVVSEECSVKTKLLSLKTIAQSQQATSVSG